MLRSINAKRLCLLLVITFTLLFFIQHADATTVTNIKGIRLQLNKLLYKGVELMADIATVGGFFLFFIGLWGFYNSHVKAQSGGKPMSHNFMMLAAGSILVAVPMFFNVFSIGLLGESKVYTFSSDSGNSDVRNIVMNNHM